MKVAPSRLAPVFLPRIWGARSLAPLFVAPPNAASEPIGEVWLTGDCCEFACGPLAGQTLGHAWPALSAEWTGTRLQGAPHIPLLVKFIFPEDKLSVQVHPNDAYARQNESAAGGTGKTEMWYAASSRAGAELCLGLEPGVTSDSFQRAIADGTVEACLRRLAVRAGDAFFVPAGTVHTVGPGMVLCEIQQHSDITYRIFDYGRVQAGGTPRPMHLRQALEVMQFGPQPAGRIEPIATRCGQRTETFLAACRYFATERWDFSEPVAAETSPEQFELLIPLNGHGRIEWGAESAAYAPAQVWFLPAALGGYRLAPESATQLLRTYVPDLAKLEQSLTARHVAAPDLARVLHP